MTGYTVPTSGTDTGKCTDIFEATGKTGKNPPAICGANTGYHSKLSMKIVWDNEPIPQVYVEFGTSATDSVTLKHTYGDTSSKQWNILARQISCTASWKYVELGDLLFLLLIFNKFFQSSH